MASSYINNLRLTEMATGEESGNWGTITNANLELIGEALGYGTRAIANASTDNITIADGSSDADRAMYLKLTGGGQACTITLLPNTSSKVWIMQNDTSYTLTFSQGSGANVTLAAGKAKIIATDGGGSGAIVYDVLNTFVPVLADVTMTGTTIYNALNDGTTTLTSSAAELNYLDITTLGTTQASKAVTVDASGDVVFPDGDKIQLGTGSDLVLQHDGSNAYIQNITGSLNLQGKSGESSIVATPDGAVTLYHDNAVKLATASGGISVTGEVAATSLDISGDVDVDGTLETDALSIASITVTSTAAELNILDGVTSTAAELNLVDGITAGTVAASKAVIVDGNKDITGYRNLTSTGTITAATNVTVSSDIRLKSNIETIDSALDKVKAMRGVYFDRHDDKATRAVGVIAQEMQEIMPEVVVTDDTEDKYLSVAYGNLVGVLIEAVKELSGKIDRLEDR